MGSALRYDSLCVRTKFIGIYACISFSRLCVRSYNLFITLFMDFHWHIWGATNINSFLSNHMIGLWWTHLKAHIDNIITKAISNRNIWKHWMTEGLQTGGSIWPEWALKLLPNPAVVSCAASGPDRELREHGKCWRSHSENGIFKPRPRTKLRTSCFIQNSYILLLHSNS